MESWQFIQSPAGDWYWLCSNVISRQTRTSTATFKTRMECVANAMGSGYQKVAPAIGSLSPQPHNKAPQQQKAPQHQRKPAQQQKAPQQHNAPAGGQPPAKRAQRRNRNKSAKRSSQSN